MSVEGQSVKIPCVRLYSDSYGKGPGKTISVGIYTCTRYIPGRIAPMHINGLGWVKCNPTGLMLLRQPPIYVCQSDESFYEC